MTRPVVDMQSIARQMSEGNFLVRAPSRSTDEIGTLGRSLNVLAARLRRGFHGLSRAARPVVNSLGAAMFLSNVSIKRPVFATMMMVALVVLGAIGIVMALGIRQIERRLLRWRPEYQKR